MPKTILIVEYSKLNMKLFTGLLQADGYRTVLSVDGADCIQLAREHRPDLILMDIQLPGVSGLEHIQALKADDALKHIPIIACTSYAMKGDKERCLNAGCDGYISKPIAMGSFLDTIAQLIGQSAPEPSAA